MKKWSGLAFLSCITFLCLINSAFALSFLGYEETGGSWYDVNKTWDDDSGLCWAASASNLLAYTGWGYPTSENFINEINIFDYYKAHWPNAGNVVVDTLEWWFDGVDHSLWANPTEPGGGFWPAYNFDDYYSMESNNSGDLMDDISSLFNAGYGALSTTIFVANTFFSHAITLWGYEYDENGDYIGIYITDSDDRYFGLMYYDIYLSEGIWYIEDYYYDYSSTTDYYLGTAVGLLSSPINNTPVPEPGTMILLGAGLIGLAGTSRKRFFKKMHNRI